MKIVNLTPPDVLVHTKDGERKKFPPLERGKGARVATTAKFVREIEGVEVISQTFEEIEGLPDPQEGTVFLVSMVVRDAAKKQGRTDVISPDTSPQGAIRNEQGQIIGTKRFVF